MKLFTSIVIIVLSLGAMINIIMGRFEIATLCASLACLIILTERRAK